jgi:hypothetical protein
MSNATKSSEEIKQEMDAAAATAAKDLAKIPAAQVKLTATWIKNYYLKAGYKRLCRLLLAQIKNKD